jgi:hypothetical protein
MPNLNAKADAALDLYGQRTYDAIPKSVFAVIAWYLAGLCTMSEESVEAHEMREFGSPPESDSDLRDIGSRILQEWDALRHNSIVPQKPSAELRKALEALRGRI